MSQPLDKNRVYCTRCSVFYGKRSKWSEETSGKDCVKKGHHWVTDVEDVAAAVAWLKEQVNELPNRDDKLRFMLPKGTQSIAVGVLDGGGVGRFEVIGLINQAFAGVSEKREVKA